MKENIIRLFDNNILGNRILVKLWDNDKNKWYFETIDVVKEENDAIINYKELLNRKQIRSSYDKN